ncbi:hypothetical protein [Paenibacillus andongensis]|uniref:hypothetical protein n=1 Tax=Paenibacillus andongensis TaxID=2975482 RepID=UPI0021BB1827|nr:hypothetical protein [Paenibacillus andongensis]
MKTISIFQFISHVGAAADSRYIQAFDLTVENHGEEEFDILIQGESECGANTLMLYHMSAASKGIGSKVTVSEVPTNFGPFSLQLVSNINDASRTAVTLFAKQGGSVIAIFTQQHFSILE